MYDVVQAFKRLCENEQHTIFHRDIKPHNILVMKDGPRFDRFILIDFGLSREWDKDLSISHTRADMGTLMYTDP